MFTIYPIQAFSDNYIWCLAHQPDATALIVDPGQARPVKDYLASNNLTLDTILVTHHHPDHVGGIRELQKEWPEVRIVGPADSPFKGANHWVYPGNEVTWHGLTFEVMAVPGHTLDHIAYFCAAPVDGQPALFCGDTLFVGGCGRLFEGTAEQMYQSLKSLRELPGETAVYCAHEYTLANLRFARSWLPEDEALARFEARCEALRAKNLPTVPSTIAQEKALNLFLRWDDPAVADAARQYSASHGLASGSESAVFAAVRHGKDHF